MESVTLHSLFSKNWLVPEAHWFHCGASQESMWSFCVGVCILFGDTDALLRVFGDQ